MNLSIVKILYKYFYLSYAISMRSHIRATSRSAHMKSSRFSAFFKTPRAFTFSSFVTSIVANLAMHFLMENSSTVFVSAFASSIYGVFISIYLSITAATSLVVQRLFGSGAAATAGRVLSATLGPAMLDRLSSCIPPCAPS